MELYFSKYEYQFMVLFKKVFLVYCFALTGAINCQPNISGNWQGIIQIDGQTIDKSALLYAEFIQKNGALEGKMRDEIFGSDLFAVKRFKGSISKNSLSFNQTIIEKQKQNSEKY